VAYKLCRQLIHSAVLDEQPAAMLQRDALGQLAFGAQLIQETDHLADAEPAVIFYALELVQFLDHGQRHDHGAVLEPEHGLWVVYQHVGVQNKRLHRLRGLFLRGLAFGRLHRVRMYG